MRPAGAGGGGLRAGGETGSGVGGNGSGAAGNETRLLGAVVRSRIVGIKVFKK